MILHLFKTGAAPKNQMCKLGYDLAPNQSAWGINRMILNLFTDLICYTWTLNLHVASFRHYLAFIQSGVYARFFVHLFSPLLVGSTNWYWFLSYSAWKWTKHSLQNCFSVEEVSQFWLCHSFWCENKIHTTAGAALVLHGTFDSFIRFTSRLFCSYSWDFTEFCVQFAISYRQSWNFLWATNLSCRATQLSVLLLSKDLTQTATKFFEKHHPTVFEQIKDVCYTRLRNRGGKRKQNPQRYVFYQTQKSRGKMETKPTN